MADKPTPARPSDAEIVKLLDRARAAVLYPVSGPNAQGLVGNLVADLQRAAHALAALPVSDTGDVEAAVDRAYEKLFAKDWEIRDPKDLIRRVLIAARPELPFPGSAIESKASAVRAALGGEA